MSLKIVSQDMMSCTKFAQGLRRTHDVSTTSTQRCPNVMDVCTTLGRHCINVTLDLLGHVQSVVLGIPALWLIGFWGFNGSVWMNDLSFYVLFNSSSVISGRWADDNESLCAMEPRLRLRRFHLERGIELGTARSVGQRLTN